MSYRMKLPTFDNSAVNTRQVRRQRERLSKKKLPGSSVRTRAELMDMPRSVAWSSSKYMPHNGKRETARRQHQAALKAADLTRNTAARWLARHAA